MNTKSFFLIAQVKTTVSTQGYLSLKIYSDDSDRFFDLDSFFIDVFGDKRKFFVEDVYVSGEFPVVKLKNFDSIDDVQFLIGKSVYLDQESEMDDDEFLIGSMIGAEIYYGDKFFGKLKDVESYPGNDVLVIQTENNDEVLVPNVKEFVTSIDRKGKQIHLNPGKDLSYDQV